MRAMTPERSSKAALSQSNSKQAVLAAQIEQTKLGGRRSEGQAGSHDAKAWVHTGRTVAGADAGAEYSRLTKGKRREAHGADRPGQAGGRRKNRPGQHRSDRREGDITATKQTSKRPRPSSPARSAILGVQSGLIARTRKNWIKLKRQGERNILSCTLPSPDSDPRRPHPDYADKKRIPRNSSTR